jgi:hypothetical protein
VRLLNELLFSPVTGPTRGIGFVVKRIRDQVEAEYLDEGKVRGELLDLELRYQHGEIDDTQYKEQEAAILDRLNEIRAYRESLEQQEDAATDEDTGA